MRKEAALDMEAVGPDISTPAPLPAGKKLMKVLIDSPLPYSFAAGGMQVQIDRTSAALRRRGIDVEPLAWWRTDQNGDVLHYFGRPDTRYLRMAQRAGIRVVFNELLGGILEKSKWGQWAVVRGTRFFGQTGERVFPRMAWTAYAAADAVIALTEWEAQLMRQMFRFDANALHVVPNGIDTEFLQAGREADERIDELVSVGVIQPRKRQLETARMAVQAGVPMRFVGSAQDSEGAYFKTFVETCARSGGMVRYEGAMEDRAELADLLGKARGFVLLSSAESLSLAALEAAAAGCPLLLSDSPWASSVFGNSAVYCRIGDWRVLKEFHGGRVAKQFSLPLWTWDQVAKKLIEIYEDVVSGSKLGRSSSV